MAMVLKDSGPDPRGGRWGPWQVGAVLLGEERLRLTTVRTTGHCKKLQRFHFDWSSFDTVQGAGALRAQKAPRRDGEPRPAAL
jgi:hypothetical protein